MKQTKISTLRGTKGQGEAVGFKTGLSDGASSHFWCNSCKDSVLSELSLVFDATKSSWSAELREQGSVCTNDAAQTGSKANKSI